MGPNRPGKLSGKLPEGSCYARSAVVPAQSLEEEGELPILGPRALDLYGWAGHSFSPMCGIFLTKSKSLETSCLG